MQEPEAHRPPEGYLVLRQKKPLKKAATMAPRGRSRQTNEQGRATLGMGRQGPSAGDQQPIAEELEGSAREHGPSARSSESEEGHTVAVEVEPIPPSAGEQRPSAISSESEEGHTVAVEVEPIPPAAAAGSLVEGSPGGGSLPEGGPAAATWGKGDGSTSPVDQPHEGSHGQGSRRPSEVRAHVPSMPVGLESFIL